MPVFVLVSAMVVAAWVVLRPPDPGHAVEFFATGFPSLAAGEAVMTLIAWLVVAAAACGAVLTVVMRVPRLRPGQRSGASVSILLVVGLLLLAVGAVQRALPAASVCCGSGAANVREAVELAR